VRRLIALLLCLPLFLVACGESSDGDNESTSEETSAATSGGGDLPTVTGKFGEKPTIKAPESAAPTELKTEVLTKGDGEEVVKGDLLVANYQGQIWKSGEVFDNSYDRGEPAGFGIGTGSVIPGWDKGLVGQTIGSRVMLVIPPEDGYGTTGNQQAGIAGDDTLVFVVDLLDHFSAELAADGKVVADLPAGLPGVENKPGEKPVVTLAKGTKEPTEPKTAVLIEGAGDDIDPAKSLVVQIVQADYSTGETSFETWGRSPISIKAEQLPGLAEVLKGKKLGSRVLVTLPKQEPQTPEQQGTAAAAIVVDVVGSF
jgi:peptidylprolyl isomerase